MKLLKNYPRDEPASLARATRVVVHSIFALGLSALGMGKVTSDIES